MRANYEYEFLPVEKQIAGETRTVIELKCLHEKGPGSKAILAAHLAVPAQIKWVARSSLQESALYKADWARYHLNDDPEFTEKSPVTSTIFAGEKTT